MPQKPHLSHTARRAIGVIIVASLMGMLFAGSFLGALHAPEPHEVKVGVVGPDAAATQLQQRLDGRMDGGFDVSGYADVRTARDALDDREVDGVLVPQEARLLTASAAGRTTAQLLTATLGRGLKVEDVTPLAKGDTFGISGFFFGVACVFVGVLLGAVFSLVIKLGLLARLGALLGGALVAGSAVAWTAVGLVGTLAGAPWQLVGIGWLLIFTVACVAAGAVRAFGVGGFALAVLVIIPIGAPASGGPVGADFPPGWYGDLGGWLPLGATTQLIRNAVYFDGSAVGGPSLVLAAWALAGLALLMSPSRRGTSPAPQPALDHAG